MLWSRNGWIILMCATTVILSSCARTFSALDKIVPDNTKKYREAKALPPLEIPPNLSINNIHDDIKETSTNKATYLEYKEQATNPLREIYGIKSDEKPYIEGEGKKRQLVVPESLEQVWSRIHGFWLENNFKIKAEDIRIGFMDVIGNTNQDNYRVQIEHGEVPQHSIIHLKQRGKSINPQQEEAAFRSLADYLGVLHAQDLAVKEEESDYQSKQKVSVLEQGTVLEVDKDFSHVWEEVGLILDRKGFTVDDHSRSRGIYYIRYNDPFLDDDKEKKKTLGSKLAFWKKKDSKSKQNQYQIKLISDGPSTRIVILDKKGNKDETQVSKHLLSLIGEQLSE
ncbi:NlpB/DapX lipoprotein [Candidatus Nitrosacidococcus tergens]|uniref:NlpB/DapX lipoprotein n=2 Tax=Candidatus Nitrosacidococcus tergens TaxID=553981 RepID=A0A7G1QBJ4_9GAMM|nr:NlpB/DapX lipoprotein [Candidatus Nitrosacidococcus tergens]